MNAAELLLVIVLGGIVATGHATSRRLDAGLDAAVALRAVVLAAPAQAVQQYCATDRADCRPQLWHRDAGSWRDACPPPVWRARYYRLVLACRLWPGLSSQRLLDVVLFR